MMMTGQERVEVSHYRMRARGFLNSVSARREFEGVLIRVGGGYGCIHPWPELGDPPLARCLEDLRGARRWPLVRRALRCAEYDAAARGREESLFEEMEVPWSHATLAGGGMAEVDAAVAAGFGVVKWKCGRDPERERAGWLRAAEAHPGLRWRLDANEAFDPEAAVAFVAGLPGDLRQRIDFFEDPSPYSEQTWPEMARRMGVALAVDREAAPHREQGRYVVIKPARDEPLLLAEAALARGQGVVVTSSMDHPLGQAFAAWEAARLGLILPGCVGICGLQTHHLFQTDAFIECLGAWKPDFQVPPGTGLGFDDLLEELPWVPLD